MIQEVVPRIAELRERSIEELEELDPPEAHEDDHARYLEGRRDRIELLGQAVDAAAAGDLVAAVELQLALDANSRDTLNDLSPSSSRSRSAARMPASSPSFPAA